MITRVSTTTENYDPRRKGRRVVTIDDLHQELIGGTIEYAPNTQSDGSYNYTEIVGGEALDDIADAIRRFFCRVTGWCEGAAKASSPPVPKKSRVVQMLPEDSGEAPGPSAAPEFDDVTGQVSDSPGPGLPASSAPEDYAMPTGTLTPGTISAVTNSPLPASALPVMTSVLNRVQAGDPAALKGLATLAQSAPFNAVSAQTLKSLATLAAQSPMTVAKTPVSAPFVTTTTVPIPGPAPAPPLTIPTTMATVTPKVNLRMVSGGMAVGGTVTHTVTQIFKLVLSPLAWTLDGTGRLTALAGQKLEHLSRLL